MQHLTYLAVMAACLIGTLPLEYAFNARVYRRFARAARAIAPVAAVFLIWDYLAIRAGWWWFDPNYITGVFVGALPIEEITFFVAIPICGILTLEAVRSLKPHWAQPWGRSGRPRPAEAARTTDRAEREQVVPEPVAPDAAPKELDAP